MATGFLSPISLMTQILSDQGIVGSGFQLFLYQAGTSTPATTYTASNLVTPNSNPIVMAANGRWQNVSIWTPAGVVLKQVWEDAANNVIAGLTIDNIPAINDITSVPGGGGVANFYGGADSGAVNAYVLTFTSPFFTGLTNGNQITWLPGHTNTGASTMNVNGLGALPITNLDGSAVTAGEIVNGQPSTIQYQSGNWVLLSGFSNLTANGNVALGGAGKTVTAYGQTAGAQIDISPDRGTFTATLRDTSANLITTGTLTWRKRGTQVTVSNDTGGNIAASTANAIAGINITGMPAAATPSVTRYAWGSLGVNGAGTPILYAQITTGGTISLAMMHDSGTQLNVGGNWGSSIQQGIQAGWSITYDL